MIEADGLDSLIVDLAGAGARAAIRAQVVIAKTAQDIVGTAQQLVPVDTSATKNSIGVDYGPDGLSAEIGPTTSYAFWLEFGTTKMAPHAFMGPAMDRHTPDFVKGLEELGGSLS